MGEFSLSSGTGFLGVSCEEIAVVNGEAKGFKLDDAWLLWVTLLRLTCVVWVS